VLGQRQGLYQDGVAQRGGAVRPLEGPPELREIRVGDHLAGGIRDDDVDHVAVARHVAHQQLQPEVVAGEERGLGAGGQVLGDRQAALAHLVGQRALLRAQEEAADEHHRRGEQRDDENAELEPERQPHRVPSR